MRNKFLLKLAIGYVKQHILDFLLVAAKNTDRKVFTDAVTELERFIEAVPMAVWVNLKKQESKNELFAILKEHDTALLKAAFNIIVEHLSEKVELHSLLDDFELKLKEVSLSVIEIFTNEISDNKSEIRTLLSQKTPELLDSSVDYIWSKSDKYLTRQQQEKLKEGLRLARFVIGKIIKDNETDVVQL